MESIGKTILFLTCLVLVQGMLKKESGLHEWVVHNIGDLEHLHYCYANDILKGLFVVTKEGVLGLINHSTGKLRWHKALPQNRTITSVTFKENYALMVLKEGFVAELWDIDKGNLQRSFPLESGHIDAAFLSNSEEGNPSFALLTSKWLKIYEDFEEIHTFQAKEDETFVMCSYDQAQNKMFVGVTSQDDRLLIHSVDAHYTLKLEGSLPYSHKSHILKKTDGYVWSIEKDSNRIVSIFNLKDAELLKNSEYTKIFCEHEDSNMFVTEDATKYHIQTLGNNQLQEITSIPKQTGTYKFGVSADGKKFAYASTEQGKLKLNIVTELEPHKADEAFISGIQEEYYGAPEQLWIDPRSDLTLIKTVDKSLHLVKEKEKLWTRQEGLTTVQKWVMGKGKKENEVEELNLSPFNMFVERTKSQVNALVTQAKQGMKFVHSLMTEKILPKSVTKSTDKNFLFGLTKYSKIYALALSDGRIQWQRMNNQPISDMFYFSSETEDSLVIITQPNESTTVIQELYPQNGTEKFSGTTIHGKITRVVPVASTFFLLFDASDNIHIYPNNEGVKESAMKIIQHLSVCHVDEKNSALRGYKVNPKTMRAVEIWRMNFETTEEIVGYASDDQLNSEQYQGLEENNGNILYKYVDPNLLAVGTITQSKDLYIYVVNRMTGTIIRVGHVYNVNGKENFKISFSENTIIVNYLKKYKERVPLLLNEMLVMKMYYPDIEDEVPRMISQYWASGIQIGNEASSKLPTPKFLNKTFIIPVPIKDVLLTKTRQGITNKHAITLTSNNQIMSIPTTALDVKRPSDSLMQEDEQFEDQTLQPYDAVIPVRFTFTLNYDTPLTGITNLQTIPHDYESTTIIVASGVDLFVSRYAPEARYDQLSATFNPWYLILMVTGLIVATLVIKMFVAKKQAKELYLLQ